MNANGILKRRWCESSDFFINRITRFQATSPLGVVSSTTPGTPGTPSSLSGPGMGAISNRDSETDSDVEGENKSTARAILEQVANEQTKTLLCQ